MTIIDSPQPEVILFEKEMPPSFSPEARAMVCSLYSRDPCSIRKHIEQVKKFGPEKFMAKYYVGYGHDSIADIGRVLLCYEHVAMLTAKAVQDTTLYNGQEASTRYLNMSQQPVINPLGTILGATLQRTSMSLYEEVLAELIPLFTEQYPIMDGQNHIEHEKAIRAKAFDVARGFLPAGCTTFAGWDTSLRHAYQHTTRTMLFHPLPEIQTCGNMSLDVLKETYPSSFGQVRTEEENNYLRLCSEANYFTRSFSLNTLFFTENIDTAHLTRRYADILRQRPRKMELPKKLDRYGEIEFRFDLDFGSYRDIQRHRSCVQLMPRLTTKLGFHPWYISQLPESLQSKASRLLAEQEIYINHIENEDIRQYYIPMGYKISCQLTAGLPSSVYIAELRSQQTVHPTLRVIAQQMGEAIQSIVPGITLHCDMSSDTWSIRRGKHDIVKVELPKMLT